MLLVPLLATLAGVITTTVGMGGGLMLVITLSLVWDPLTALTTTSLALLVGNVHRIHLYRVHAQWRSAGRFAVGAAPGAMIGGWVAVGLPEHVLRGILVALATLAVAKVVSGWAWRPPAGVLVPGGAPAGFVTGTSGGGGLIAGPLWIGSGLSGREYVATGAVGAASIHVGRITSYGAGGALDTSIAMWGAAAALCIAGGNLLGDHLRGYIPGRLIPKLEVGAVVACLAVSLAGMT